MAMTMKIDSYKGTMRIWKDACVYTGLVSVGSKAGYSYYAVRENGRCVKYVAGLSRRTKQLASDIVAKYISEVK